jgi:hypothetical protein
VLVAIACLLGLFATLGCYPPSQPLPTVGPVSAGGDRPQVLDIGLSASTNCAAIGEPVVFTLEVISTTTQTLVLTGTPTLDIVFEPARWPGSQPRPQNQANDPDHDVMRTFWRDKGGLPGALRSWAATAFPDGGLNDLHSKGVSSAGLFPLAGIAPGVFSAAAIVAASRCGLTGLAR